VSERAYLPTYLNDHLAGATFGVELARRTARSNADRPSGPALRALADEIEKDRRSLLDVMERLEASRDRLKTITAWGLEKAGRLKLNGELLHRSRLSRLVELEALALGVEGKLSLWRSLDHALGDDPRLAGVDLDALIARARSQRRRIERLRLAAAAASIGG
jgi:hypothetical protein